MKVLVNYVIQEDIEHRHESEVIDIISPPYTFSPEAPAIEVMKWIEKKQEELEKSRKLVVTSIYKI